MDNTARLTKKLIQSTMASTNVLQNCFKTLMETIKVNDKDIPYQENLLSLLTLTMCIVNSDNAGDFKHLLPQFRKIIISLSDDNKQGIEFKTYITKALIEVENQDLEALRETLQVLWIKDDEVKDFKKLEETLKQLRKTIRQTEREFTQKIVAITRAA